MSSGWAPDAMLIDEERRRAIHLQTASRARIALDGRTVVIAQAGFEGGQIAHPRVGCEVRPIDHPDGILPRVERVVHLPETALRARALAGLGGRDRMAVLGHGEMAVHDGDVPRVLVSQGVELAGGHPAERALEVGELDDRDGRPHRTCPMPSVVIGLPVPDGFADGRSGSLRGPGELAANEEPRHHDGADREHRGKGVLQEIGRLHRRI